MVNPIKHANKAIGDLFTAANQCDYFDHTVLKTGAVLITPVGYVTAFISAFFKPSDSK